MIQPNSLQALVGKKYRIELDESYKHETPENRKADRIWLEQIPCASRGIIYLKSLNPVTLALHTTTRRAKNIVEQVEGCEVQYLDGEAMVFFQSKLFSEVAPLAGARVKRTRTMTDEQKAKLVEAGRQYRESKGKQNV